MNKTYLILPGCDDQNRGDQALIWETVEIAKEAGYIGEYYMLSQKGKGQQSYERGIFNVDYILKHPSRTTKQTNNINYTKLLKIKWGMVAIIDFITKEPLVHPVLRRILYRFYNQEVQESLRKFEETDTCFVKGGGFLHAYGGIAETYKIYYFLYHIRLALSFGKKVYVMPNSFGPFEGPMVKKMLFKTLNACEVVMSREKVSCEQLEKECDVKSSLYTDIAFYLEADKKFDAKAELIKYGVPVGERKCIGITMRPYRFPDANDAEGKYIKYKESLARFISWLNKKNIYPVLIEHVFDEQEHENDMVCIEDVVKLIDKQCEYSVFSNRELNCSQMKKIYGEFDYLLGTRFHSVIFALSSSVPSIAITYGGNKGKGIMVDLGMDKYSISIYDITYEQLVSIFRDMQLNYNSIRERLEGRLYQMRLQKDKIIDEIKDVKLCQH